MSYTRFSRDRDSLGFFRQFGFDVDDYYLLTSVAASLSFQQGERHIFWLCQHRPLNTYCRWPRSLIHKICEVINGTSDQVVNEVDFFPIYQTIDWVERRLGLPAFERVFDFLGLQRLNNLICDSGHGSEFRSWLGASPERVLVYFTKKRPLLAEGAYLSRFAKGIFQEMDSILGEFYSALNAAGADLRALDEEALLRGSIIHSVELGDNTASLDLVIYRLLERHNQDAPLSDTVGLVLASAQPPRDGYFQEVFILVSEDPTQAVVCWDARSYNGGLQACMHHPHHRVDLVVAPAWSERGWRVAANGIPSPHQARNIRDGDLLQPFAGNRPPAATPLSWVLSLLPSLQPLAWRLQVDLQRDPFLRSLRHRRQQLGFHFFEEGLVRIVGPMHGDLRLRTGRHHPVDLNHVRAAVARLAQFPDIEFWDTPVAGSEGGLFVSLCPNSNLNTVLVPAPGFDGHYFPMLVSTQVRELVGIPATAHTVFYTRRELRQGDVLAAVREPVPPEADSQEEDGPPADAAGLLQVSATRIVNFPSGPSEPKNHGFGAFPEKTARQEGEIPNPSSFLGRFSLAESRAGKLATRIPAAGSCPGCHVPTPFGRRRIPPHPEGSLANLTGSPTARLDGAEGGNALVQGPSAPVHATACSQSHPATPRSLKLADVVAAPRAGVTWGVNAEICDAVFEGHGLHTCAYSPALYGVQPCAALFHWASLPPWLPDVPLDEVFIFSDGSYYESGRGSTWAIVVLVRQGHHVGRVGACAGLTRGAAYTAAGFERADSAFNGELEAILHAFAVAAAAGAPIIHLGVDCQAALDIAQGHVATAEGDRVARAVVGLRAYLAFRGAQVFFHKIESHTGCAFNDLADLTAKAVGRHGEPAGIDASFPSLWCAIAEEVVDRLWLVPLHPAHAIGLPPLREDGTWSAANCSCRLPTALGRPFCMPEQAQTAQDVLLDFRLMQYNALSLKGAGALELFAAGLRRSRVDIAGVQETRLRHDGLSTQGDFWVLSAPASPKGVGGAQVWVRQQAAWDAKAFSVVHKEAQLLVVLGSFQGVRLLMVSAHAPPTDSPEADLQAWWQHLCTVLHRTPASCVPIIFVDANATFQRDPTDPSTAMATPTCRNARHLRHFAESRGLGLTPQAFPTGEPLVSWISPSGKRKLIDYIGFPADWTDTTRLLPAPDLGDLHADIDHRPIATQLQARVAALPEVRRCSLDPRVLQSPGFASAVTSAAVSCPAVPWCVDGAGHVDQLQSRVFSRLHEFSPEVTARPRHPALTPPTLDLIRLHRHLRRCTRRVQQTADQAYLHLCFQAWVRKADTEAKYLRSDKRHRVAAARQWALQYRTSKEMRAAMWADKAAFTRLGIEQARSAGPATFAYKLRAILRTGRRYKPPALLPCLSDEADCPMGRREVAESFGRFFAQAERAVARPVARVLQASTQVLQPPSALDGRRLPTLAGLAAGFASLQRGRAPGLSGLGPDVYRVDPLLFAIRYFPVVCKTYLRDPAPGQWTGGLAVAIPKPQKPSTAHQGFRSVMLLECDNKAVQKAARPRLLELLPALGVPDQMGGRPGFTLSLPAACVKAHLAFLKRTKTPGAVIFVDATSAYYSITRDFLSLTPEQRRDASFLQNRASLLFTDAGLQQQFIQMAQRDEAAQAFCESPELRIYVQKQLEQTWYVSRHDADSAYFANSGTAPGAPLADLLFSLVFGGVLRRTRDFLLRRGFQAAITCSAAGQRGFTPTWADDVSLLLQVQQADQVAEAVAATMEFFTEELDAAGLQANHGQGKTEAIVSIYGSGSREARRNLLTQEDPAISFSTRRGPARVRIVPHYQYLGSCVQANGQALPDIVHRRSLAQEVFRPAKARILRNPAITFEEKILLLRSRILSRFLHGAGLWSLGTSREREAVAEAIYGFYRGAFQPLVGLSGQGFTNLEVASILGLPLPEELLSVERVRTVVQLARAEFWPVLQELSYDAAWWTDVGEALVAVGILQSPPGCPTDLHACAAIPKSRLSAACKAFLRKATLGRQIDRKGLRARPPCDQAVVLSARSTALPWNCDLCGSAFRDKRALCVHKVCSHGVRASHVVCAVGTRCEVCRTEFWHRSRLAEHLRKQDACRVVYEEGEIGGAPPEREPGSSAWRPCAPSYGPPPWWATLRPDRTV